MAVLKINVSRSNFKQLIKYVRSEEKTNEHIYESVWNLHSPETAYEEMKATKERLSANDGVQAYHFIQSFKPGEINPEKANEIGREFARRYFKDEYEVLICTHIDKNHCHNHLIVNSVNRVTGKKFHSSKQDMIKYRVCSDIICNEYGLSTIVRKNFKGKHYAEWNAEKQGKPTIRSLVKKDIEKAIKNSYGSWHIFERRLQQMDYQIKYGKYMSVKPPFAERFVRLDKMGYSQENINNKLANWKPKYHYPNRPIKHYKYLGNLAKIRPYKTAWQIFCELLDSKSKWVKVGTKWRHKTDEEILVESLAGLTVGSIFIIFSLFIMLLKLVARSAAPPSITGFLKNDVIRLDKYQKQFEIIKAGKMDNKTKGTAIDIIGKLDKIQELRAERQIQRQRDMQEKSQTETKENATERE